MYYFFKNKSNRNAFVKALKEVEREGYYVNQSSDDDVVFTTNMSKAVAELSGTKVDRVKPEEKSVDINEYNPNLEQKRVIPANPSSIQAGEYTLQQNPIREKLFGGDSTFLDGKTTQEKEFLSNASSDSGFIFEKNDNEIQREIDFFLDAQRRKEIDDERLRENHEHNERKISTFVEQREREIDEERLRANREYNERKLAMLEKLKAEREEKEKQAQLLVEVVADKEERREEQSATVTKKVEEKPNSKHAIKKTAASKKKKPTTTKKKKKKYDADIIGGIDY